MNSYANAWQTAIDHSLWPKGRLDHLMRAEVTISQVAIALFVYLVIVLILNLEIMFIPIPAHAGMPNSCPVPGHGGPLCKMEACNAIDKDGKQVPGNNCSKYCAEKCCLCTTACPKEHNQYPDQGEQWLRMGFGD